MGTEFEIGTIGINTSKEVAGGILDLGPVRLQLRLALDGNVIIDGAQVAQPVAIEIGIAMRAKVLARIGELFAAQDRKERERA